VAAQLCTFVFEGNLPALRRLVRAGADVDAGDYDRRTALHISAAEGNLQAVRGRAAELASLLPPSLAARSRWQPAQPYICRPPSPAYKAARFPYI
jgi:ankyrin repeat protein